MPVVMPVRLPHAARTANSQTTRPGRSTARSIPWGAGDQVTTAAGRVGSCQVSNAKGLRVLVLDPDPVSGQQVAMTLDAAGLDPQACPFESRALIETLKQFNPQVLWVRAELG